MNRLRTTILLAALTALVVWIGQMFGGPNGAVIALVFAGVMKPPRCRESSDVTGSPARYDQRCAAVPGPRSRRW